MEFEDKMSLESRNTTDVDDKVTEWLARQFDTKHWNVTDLLRTQNATVYLLIWPIMEQKLFDGFMQAKKIDSFSEKMGEYFNEMDAEHKVRYFYNRYQDKEKYRRLTDSKNYPSMEEVLAKEYDALTGRDKMVIMMTTVYRYRNNIFHGNKAIGEWNKYSKEIKYCIEFMMSVVDVYKSFFGDVSEKD